MNDAELNRTLKAAEPPQRTDEYWADFPGQVARGLSRPFPPERPVTNWLPITDWYPVTGWGVDTDWYPVAGCGAGADGPPSTDG